MREMATLTMLMSRTDMKLPTMSTTSGTIHPWAGAGLPEAEPGPSTATAPLPSPPTEPFRSAEAEVTTRPTGSSGRATTGPPDRPLAPSRGRGLLQHQGVLLIALVENLRCDHHALTGATTRVLIDDHCHGVPLPACYRERLTLTS